VENLKESELEKREERKGAFAIRILASRTITELGENI